MNPARLLWLGVIVAAAVVSSQALAAGGSNMNLSNEEETQIRKAIETTEEHEVRDVLNGNVAAMAALGSDDLTVNAPSNQVRHQAQILELMKQHTGIQYSSFERHREAMVVRRDCVVTMGYEIVVPKGKVPDSGKTINRRYINVFYFEDGTWHLIARQATNVSVK